MRPSERIRNSLKQQIQICNETDRIMKSFNSRMEQQILESYQSISQFQTSFEMQINLIEQSQVLSKSRLENLIASDHELQFWNKLKESIMERQIKENEQLKKIAEQVRENKQKGIESEEKIHQELMAEAEEGAERKAGKFKSLTNNRESKFHSSQKSIQIIVDNGKEKSRFELKYLQQNSKYVPSQQYHPKALQLISQFNFHHDLPRLQEELTSLVHSLS